MEGDLSTLGCRGAASSSIKALILSCCDYNTTFELCYWKWKVVVIIHFKLLVNYEGTQATFSVVPNWVSNNVKQVNGLPSRFPGGQFLQLI